MIAPQIFGSRGKAVEHQKPCSMLRHSGRRNCFSASLYAFDPSSQSRIYKTLKVVGMICSLPLNVDSVRSPAKESLAGAASGTESQSSSRTNFPEGHSETAARSTPTTLRPRCSQGPPSDASRSGNTEAPALWAPVRLSALWPPICPPAPPALAA